MRKFRFTLHTVLRTAEQDEDRLKLELAWLQVQRQELQKQLDAFNEARTVSKESLIKQSQGVIDLEKIKTLLAHIETLDEQIQVQLTKISQMEQEITQKMEQVVEAMKKRQMLEKLRERELQEYDLAFKRMEIRLIDDVTAPRYAMKGH